MEDNLKDVTLDDNHEEEYYEYKGEGGKIFKLPIEFKEEFGKRLSIKEKKVKSLYDEELKKIMSEKDQIANELMEIKKASMSEKERKELEEKLLAEKMTKLSEEKEKAWNLFKTKHSETEIYSELSKYDLYNSKQVLKLLKSEGQIDVIDESGEYKTVIKMNGKLYSVSEAIKEFLEQSENSNLLKNTLLPGSNTTKSTSSPGGTVVFTQKQLANDPEKRKEYNKLLESGIIPEVKK